MRVLHVSPYFPPERVGGVGVAVYRLHTGLLEQGHDSQVLTRGRFSEPSVHRVARGRFAWLLSSLRWARSAGRFDIVHFQGGEALPLLVVLRLRGGRARIMTTFHVSYEKISQSLQPYTVDGRIYASGLGFQLLRSLKCSLRRWLDGLALRLSDEACATSHAAARDLVPQSREAIRVIHCGLPPPNAVPRDVAAEPVELLYVGVANHTKRVVVLPHVLRRVRMRIPDAKLRIVGFELRCEPELEALFEECGVASAVASLPAEPPETVARHYAAAEVLLVPSAHEGLPLVILEAMQYGVPVVASRVGGIAEAVEDGRSGFLVEAGDIDAMTERCVQLLSDRSLRDAMAQNARVSVETRFSMRDKVEDYLAVWTEMIGAPNATDGV